MFDSRLVMIKSRRVMFKSKHVIFDSTLAMFYHTAAELDLFEKIVQTAVNFAESQPE
jgi:hypothetical protein